MSLRDYQLLFNRLAPAGVLTLYAGFTLLWIASSDWLLTLIVRQPGALSYIGPAKGFLFVALSAGFFFLLLRSWRRMADSPGAVAATPAGRRFLLVFAALAVSVPLIDSGLIYQRGEALEQATYADLKAVAGLKQAEIEQWLAERREDGEALASDQGFARQIAQLLADRDPVIREDVRSRLDAFRLRRDYQGALLLDPRGRSILGGEDAPAQDRGSLSEALESGRVTATPLYYDGSGRLRLDWIVPVGPPVDGQQDRPAAVVLTLEPNALFPLIQAWPTASPSGEVLLVRRDGDSVVLLNALRYRSSAIPILPLGKLETDSPSLAAAGAVQTGVTAGRDYRGVPVLAAWQTITGTDWRVVAKVDRDEVMAPLRRFLTQVTLVALLTLAVVASIVLFSFHQRRRAEEALRSSEAALNRAQVVGQLGSWSFDARIGEITWSAECYRIFGIVPSTPLTHQTFLDCVHPQDREYVDRKWKEAVRGAPYDIEHRIVVGDYVKWVRERAELRLGPDGELLGGIGTVQDITQRKNAEAELEFMADHDPLTRLANRRLMLSRLQHALDLARRRRERLALLMLDLDRFKDVNDSFGHMAGDELLVEVAAELTACQRGSDTVARLGGDEFTVLLEGLASPEDAAQVAEKIVCTLNQPWRLSNGIEVRVGASVGIALYPEHGQTAEVLLQHVDAALYRAKEEGRGCVRYFTNDLTEAARNRVELAARLRRAIAQHELQLYYQPQVDVLSGAIVGAEALVRWHDPDVGWVSPGLFIAVAEETGIMGTIGAWVLTETCRQGAQWIRDGLPPVMLSVNFSPYQFRHSDIGTTLARVLAQTGFPPERLELELTESALMARVEEVEATLRRLREQGVRLAIDDFGTGYSSFAHLKRFPIDVLKIDKSFTDEIPYNRDSREIAAAIVAMAHVLGMEVVAEGVETAEQLAFLRSKGCDRYQGFLMSPAIPADAFATWLTASSLRSATGAS